MPNPDKFQKSLFDLINVIALSEMENQPNPQTIIFQIVPPYLHILVITFVWKMIQIYSSQLPYGYNVAVSDNITLQESNYY